MKNLFGGKESISEGLEGYFPIDIILFFFVCLFFFPDLFLHSSLSGNPEPNYQWTKAHRVPSYDCPQEQPGHRAENQTGCPHGQTSQHEAQRVSHMLHPVSFFFFGGHGFSWVFFPKVFYFSA